MTDTYFRQSNMVKGSCVYICAALKKQRPGTLYRAFVFFVFTCKKSRLKIASLYRYRSKAVADADLDLAGGQF